MAAFQYLLSYLIFLQSTSDSREIWPLLSAVMTDRVAVLATIVCKYGSSAGTLLAR